MAGDWAERDAVGIVVYGRTGPLIALMRVDGEWREAKPPSGGQPTHPQGSERLAPDELIDALRGPLGASESD
jgi:hypothetical protein